MANINNKVMTQEEKAKAYDKALERAKEIINSYEKRGLEEILFYAKEDLGGIFPELKEGEYYDERIRKAIILTIKDNQTLVSMNGFSKNDMIAWLEKQGEKEFTFKSIPRLLEMIEPTDRAKSYCQKLIDSLVKEGYATDAKIAGECLKQINGENVPMAVMDEQNPVNKFEPKFHEGAWITNGEHTWKIVEVMSLDYMLQSQDGNIVDDTISYVDEHFHLWSIEDAKDGDVLAYETDEEDLWIMIYWSLYEPYEGHVHYHALLVNDNFSDKGTCCICINDLKPATKEQRDMLFQKMKEVGYEWNPQKKELKKIELTKSESEEELSDFEAALFSAFSDGWQQYLHGEEVDVAQWAKEHSAELLEAAKQNHIAWSEEDESMYTRTLGILGKCYIGELPTKVEEELNWFKSIKRK